MHQVQSLGLLKLSSSAPYFHTSHHYGDQNYCWFPHLESGPRPLSAATPLAGFLKRSPLKSLPCFNPPTTTPFKIKPKFHTPGFLRPHTHPQPHLLPLSLPTADTCSHNGSSLKAPRSLASPGLHTCHAIPAGCNSLPIPSAHPLPSALQGSAEGPLTQQAFCWLWAGTGGDALPPNVGIRHTASQLLQLVCLSPPSTQAGHHTVHLWRASVEQIGGTQQELTQ